MTRFAGRYATWPAVKCTCQIPGTLALQCNETPSKFPGFVRKRGLSWGQTPAVPRFLLAPWKTAASFCKVTTISSLRYRRYQYSRATSSTEASAFQSRTRSARQRLLCTGTMLSYCGCKGQDDAPVTEAGSQSFCSKCLMGRSQFNPRLCCNSQTLYSQTSRTSYYIFFFSHKMSL